MILERHWGDLADQAMTWWTWPTHRSIALGRWTNLAYLTNFTCLYDAVCVVF